MIQVRGEFSTSRFEADMLGNIVVSPGEVKSSTYKPTKVCISDLQV